MHSFVSSEIWLLYLWNTISLCLFFFNIVIIQVFNKEHEFWALNVPQRPNNIFFQNRISSFKYLFYTIPPNSRWILWRSALGKVSQNIMNITLNIFRFYKARIVAIYDASIEPNISRVYSVFYETLSSVPSQFIYHNVPPVTIKTSSTH